MFTLAEPGVFRVLGPADAAGMMYETAFDTLVCQRRGPPLTHIYLESYQFDQ